MKKVVYLLILSLVSFIACTPLDDVYPELDEKNPNTNNVIGEDEYILTEEDYNSLNLKNTYFESEDQAKELLPEFLKKKYDFWSKGSSAKITYNISNLTLTDSYELTGEDYKNIGLEALNSDSDYRKFLEYKYPNVNKGDVVNLTYLTNPQVTDYTLVETDYALVGNGRYKNFDIRAGKPEELESVRLSKVSTILLNNFPEANVGDIYNVNYTVYDGKRGVMSMTVILDEKNPSNIKDYSLVDTDYALVGNSKYNNFDVRSGKPEEDPNVIVGKINKILLNNFSDAKEGVVYKVSYKIYNGAAETANMKLILEKNVWKLFEALSYQKYTFAYVKVENTFAYANKWAMPLELTSEDYNVLGQKYGNFTGKTDEQKLQAYGIIAKYLTNKFPYESKGAYKTVKVKFYVGGGKTITAVPNFIFDGTVWALVKESLPTTLQFGFDGETWVPDNTIKYTLTGDDYALVGNEKYKNFDIRTGKDEEKIEARIAKISTILLNNFPKAEDGQKYLVTYAIYDGSSGTLSIKVEKKGDKYVLFKE